MTVFEKIKEILIDLSSAKEIEPESVLQNDLALDSLHMVMLLIEIEDKFDIMLDESDMNPFNLITVKDVVNLVLKYNGDSDEKIS